MTVPRKLKWILILVLAVIALTATVTVVDYKRAKSDKRPKFSYRSEFYLDGGTSKYTGLGYGTTYYQKRSIRIDTDGSQYEEVLVGPEYKHWILPLRHRNVRTVVTQIAGPTESNNETQVEDANGGRAPR